MKCVLLFLAIAGTLDACRHPPSLWCSSKEIAIQCEVYNQCDKWVWREPGHASLVDFELYFESLCPDCQNFVIQQLYPTYNKVGHIMNLTLFPYGNAEEKKVGNKWVFHCQHGETECVGNLLETCSIHFLRDMQKIVPFINCMESSGQSPLTAVHHCAVQQSVPLDPILSCYNSSLGNQLEHEMAQHTDALNPPHEYVPWVVLNGIHTEKINDEATTNLLKLICDTYIGPKPSACVSTQRKSSSSRPGIF